MVPGRLWVRILLTLHSISINRNYRQWVIQLAGDIDSHGILDDIIPLRNALDNRLDLTALKIMLLPQMRVNLMGINTMLALTAYNNL